MDDLNNITFDALYRYFKVLESIGYVNDTDVNKLLLLQFLQEFLLEYQYYITEEDYTYIEKILQCFSQTSCLFPFREYKRFSVANPNYVYNAPIRITEEGLDNGIRYTEDNEYVRLVNQ